MPLKTVNLAEVIIIIIIKFVFVLLLKDVENIHENSGTFQCKHQLPNCKGKKKKREIEARVMQGLKKEERINVYIGI